MCESKIKEFISIFGLLRHLHFEKIKAELPKGIFLLSFSVPSTMNFLMCFMTFSLIGSNSGEIKLILLFFID